MFRLQMLEKMSSGIFNFIRGIELKKNGENYRDENEWLEREGMDGFHISN